MLESSTDILTRVLADELADNLVEDDDGEVQIIPPSGERLLLDDAGDFMLDDAGDYMTETE